MHLSTPLKKFSLLVIFACLVLVLYVAFDAVVVSQDNAIVLEKTNSAVLANQAIGKPIRINIPKIKVSAPIEHLGLQTDGAVAVPKGPHTVAWFKLGPKPGTQGSAVISGHYGPWKNGAQSIFNNLYQLKKGDKVYVTDEKGSVLVFVVQGQKKYNPGVPVPEVFTKDDGTYLNLITCNGTWIKSAQTFTKRLVVFTKLEKIIKK